MATLSETWFAEGYIDFEQKKYTLLAYLQDINNYFSENKLYPQLADIIFHYNNIVAFRDNKKLLQQRFPKGLTGVQIQKLELLYEQLVNDDELMQELESIIFYATQKMKKTISNGTEIYEWVEQHLSINPVGLVPIEQQEGYFFLSQAMSADTEIYYYRLSIFEKHQEKYRSIKTEFVDNQRRSISNNFEHIKSSLIRSFSVLPNPAVYVITSDFVFPVKETLLPVAKRYLVRYITGIH